MGREQPWMCARCGYAMDAYSCFANEKAAPKEHDVSLCMNCGAEYVRHADRWQLMTAAERAALEPRVLRQIEELQMARAMAIREDLAKGGGRA